MNVLILEDNDDFAQTLTDLLSMHGHTAVVVGTLELAREKLTEECEFDVAVFDLNLGNDNSIGLLRDAKRRNAALRVVAITGGGKVEADIGLPLATANGADAVLFKPFSNDDFLRAVSGSA